MLPATRRENQSEAGTGGSSNYEAPIAFLGLSTNAVMQAEDTCDIGAILSHVISLSWGGLHQTCNASDLIDQYVKKVAVIINAGYISTRFSL